MLAITKSMALHGLEGYLISIEVDISAGMPYFEIVGLPDASVREARERVRTAIRNSGVKFLSRRIVVNLAPANTKKEGSMFDLPIAVGILVATENIKNVYLEQFLQDTIFIGELSLNGNIEKINGILPICLEAQKLGIKRIILPKENAKEAAIIKEIEVLPVNNLKEVMEYLNGNIEILKQKYQEFSIENIEQDNVDFENIKGQEDVKRALEIAAAGGHNCLLIR
jgi:magnesium chelatase family protein